MNDISNEKKVDNHAKKLRTDLKQIKQWSDDDFFLFDSHFYFVNEAVYSIF